MRVGVVRVNRWRAGVVTLVAAGLVLSACTSDPVAPPSEPLTMQSDQSVLSPTSGSSPSSVAAPSTTPSAPQSLPPSSGTGEPSGSGDDDPPTGDPTSPDPATPDPSTPDPSTADPSTADPSTADPSTVSSTVQTDPTTSDDTDPGGSTATPRPPTSPPVTSQPTTPMPTTGAPTASEGEEAADRKAVEAAWVKYWGVFTNLVDVPKDQRRKVYAEVAIDPQLSKMVKDAAFADEEKLANYGTVVHRPYWSAPISITKDAILGDCMDQTKFGIFDVAASKALSHGAARVNVQATLKRTGDSWKVVGYVEKSGTSC